MLRVPHPRPRPKASAGPTRSGARMRRAHPRGQSARSAGAAASRPHLVASQWSRRSRRRRPALGPEERRRLRFARSAAGGSGTGKPGRGAAERPRGEERAPAAARLPAACPRPRVAPRPPPAPLRTRFPHTRRPAPQAPLSAPRFPPRRGPHPPELRRGLSGRLSPRPPLPRGVSGGAPSQGENPTPLLHPASPPEEQLWAQSRWAWTHLTHF